MKHFLVNLEYRLFTLLVNGNFVSIKTMDKWIDRLRDKEGPLSNTTIFVNPNIWDAMAKHPDLKRANTIDQLCDLIDHDSSKDVVYIGSIDGTSQRALFVSGAKIVVENANSN